MKTSILLTFVFFTFFLQSITFGQVTQEWARTYNGPANGYDKPVVMVLGPNENIYIAGTSAGTGSGNDIVTIRYNSQGIVQWVQRYSGPGNGEDKPTGIYVDASGYVYVTGYSSRTTGGFDFVTIKYGPDGVVQWVQLYNGPGNGDDKSAGIFAASNGSVFVTGTSQGSGTGSDFATIKYNSQGVQQFVTRYNDTLNGNETVCGITSDNVYAVYVTGTTWNGTNNDIITIRYDFSGVQTWVKSYNGVGNGNDAVNAITCDYYGVYVVGSSPGIGTGLDYITIKYTPFGVLLWDVRENGLGNLNDEAKAITIDNDENVYVTGYTNGIGTGLDIATYKYDIRANLLWSKRYNLSTTTNDLGNSVAVDQSGGVYVAGASNPSSLSYDFVTLKYSPTGVQQWVTFYNGAGYGFDTAFVVKVAASGAVYVTGISMGNSTNYDIVTIKYDQFVTIKNVNEFMPKEFSLHQNFPNPFNPTTKIKFDLPKKMHVDLFVYDILGIEKTYINYGEVNPGTYEFEWNGNLESSGVYFYKIIAGDIVSTKKMMLLK